MTCVFVGHGIPHGNGWQLVMAQISDLSNQDLNINAKFEGERQDYIPKPTIRQILC